MEAYKKEMGGVQERKHHSRCWPAILMCFVLMMNMFKWFCWTWPHFLLMAPRASCFCFCIFPLFFSTMWQCFLQFVIFLLKLNLLTFPQSKEYKKENTTLAADPQSWCVLYCHIVQVVLLNMASFFINGARDLLLLFLYFPPFLFNNVAMLLQEL